ncbi:MAG: RNA-binding protein [Actinobacteria bacterium]|nr:RNA-binding protein [Actinomycetota bacterium]
MKIYVGNLSYNTSEEDIRAAFSEFGTIDSVAIITDRNTGRSKGFGFVEMNDDSEAKAAIEGMNGKDLDGRSLNVNEARPRRERPQRSGRY